MKKILLDLLCTIGVFVAAYVVYFILLLLLAWGLSWSNTIIAIFIFMGCPILLTIAYWCSIGMGFIPIRTKFFLVISEIILCYFMVWEFYAIWHTFATSTDGWEIALKVVYTLINIGVFVFSSIFLYNNSKDKWNNPKFFSFYKKENEIDSRHKTNNKDYKNEVQETKVDDVTIIDNENLYQTLFIERLHKKYPTLSEDELYKKAMEDYDDQHEFVKRINIENEQMAHICEKCIDFAIIYSGFFERIDNELPELALLDIQQPLKDLIAGRITIEQYKQIKAQTL